LKKLDGAGTAKLASLDEAITLLTRVHGLVERLAIEVRGNKNTSQLRQSIQRAATPMAGVLKAQFGMISDIVSSLLLVLTRGGGEQMRLRALREHVAQIRTALEIAVAKVHEQHTVDDQPPSSPAGQ
jgi:hypothetical protein